MRIITATLIELLSEKQTKGKGIGGMAQVIEYLPIKHKALRSMASIALKKGRKGKRKEGKKEKNKEKTQRSLSLCTRKQERSCGH
jgi:hypothetical protein